MLGIEDRVHFGQGVNGYREPDDGGVLLTLADGATRRTDALVGADGVNSAIRRLRLPHAAPADTGSACIYGKTPLDAALDSRLTSATSVIFGPDYAIVVDPMRFRFPTQAGALTPVADYLYWAVIGGRDALGRTAATARRCCSAWARCWKPAPTGCAPCLTGPTPRRSPCCPCAARQIWRPGPPAA